MQWLKALILRFFDIPEHIIKVQVDGEPAGEPTFDSLMAMAGMFRTVPGLQESWMADFRDTMLTLEKLPGEAHFDRVRLVQKACDLWRMLSIPRTCILAANAFRDAQRAEREDKEPTQAHGPQTVM